ncbi:FxSxx-COOH system tetratricopeptide repeat protein, partial [Thermopolyspora sp. NPDC052614]|uniref:FxSxx-COOH system tetratricopeptide repeat protein n=1 Tax=Thermopolyspora sp. NPDC052614 TaxID=3155682 RepID=UPI003417CFC7
MGGNNPGIISTGDHTINQQTVLPAEALRPLEQVTAPPRLVNVPKHEQVFVGRGEELSKLERSLAGSGRVVVAAVHGLGGIGKSTLAAHYAAEQAQTGRFNPVWWITADTPASIEAGLAALATELQPELAAALPSPVLAQRAVRWLACHPDWLLVLDNVTHPDHITDLLGRTLVGHVLVTSRLSTGWHQLNASLLRLDVLTEDESIDLLTRLAANGNDSPDLDGAAELVRELGCLPLAIEQAGAYLHQTSLSPRAYLNLLTEHPAAMYGQAAPGTEANRTIARIWRLTLSQFTDTPLGIDLLRILAWYAPEAIPRGILSGFAEPPQLQQALGTLAAYSMITLDNTSITVHRLVQTIARTPDPDDPHRQRTDIRTALQQATALLDAARPTTPYADPTGWPTWRALLPHITDLTIHSSPDSDTLHTAHLLNQLGLFLGNQGDLIRAIDCHRRAHAACQRLLGDNHPDTLNTRISLASAHQSVGDLDRAISLYEHTLTTQERVLGDDHPATLITRNNLAGAYELAGDLDRAISLYEHTLTTQERVLGDDHPATLTTRNNLAHAYQSAGDLDRAISLYEHTLTTR